MKDRCRFHPSVPRTHVAMSTLVGRRFVTGLCDDCADAQTSADVKVTALPRLVDDARANELHYK